MNSKGINLLRSQKETKQAAPFHGKLRFFRLGAILMLFVVGMVSVLISTLIAFSPLPELQKNEAAARKNLSAYTIDINKLAFVNERGDSIREILQKRRLYDNNLDKIVGLLPAGVFLDGFTLVQKRYTLRFSSSNLESLDFLLNAIVGISGKDGNFVRVYQSSLAFDGVRNTFVLVVDLLSV